MTQGHKLSTRSRILPISQLAKGGISGLTWTIRTKRAPSAFGCIHTLRAASLNTSILAGLARHWVAANIEQIAALAVFKMA